MILTTQQDAAIKAVAEWLKDKDKQEFKLFGFAGTGKTTLSKLIGEMVEKVMFMTFTGKAALVLESKGCSPASTIHRAIYKVHQDQTNGKWFFGLDHDSQVKQMDLIIVDEGPMVGAKIARDLLKLAKKVLVLGDPFQLDPVKDDEFWGLGKPDFMLTDIRRQAADNPIIRMSMDIREKGMLMPGKYGESLVTNKRKFSPEMFDDFDQVLCGKNNSRKFYNQQFRLYSGFDSEEWPQAEERLICLRNDYNMGFFNGSMWAVKESSSDGCDVECWIRPLDQPETPPSKISTPMEYFTGDEYKLDWKIRKSVNEFTFGYVITTHKSQGSQWNNVMIFDESSVFRESAAKWLYTSVTRAAEKVLVLR